MNIFYYFTAVCIVNFMMLLLSLLKQFPNKIYFSCTKYQKALLLLQLIRIHFFIAILFLLPAKVTLAQDVLLGLTSTGGPEGGGTVFSISSTGTDFKVQKTFSVSGTNPSESLCSGNDGNFYGMTAEGGSDGMGTIFKMTPSGKITIIKNFTYLDGSYPQGSLIQGLDGDFYGMTAINGSNHSYGSIFKITPEGTFTALHYFNGELPQGSLVQGSDSSFYGMTYQGGLYKYGTIFKIKLDGKFTVIHHLNSTTSGSFPYGNLVQGNDGNFYGMTSQGGTFNYGTVFRITPKGTLTVLRHLNYKTDGASPYGSLVKGTNGYFYGMTFGGGINGYGTIFRLAEEGGFKVLHHFSTNDGTYPEGSLMRGLDGDFYGLTTTTFFKISPIGKFTIIQPLDNFAFNPKGSSLVQDSIGNFYGMTTKALDTEDKGTIFKITPNGKYITLVKFPEISNSNHPNGSLVQARNGEFYGTTNQGGINNVGTVFKICTDTFLNLVSFNTYLTGGNPTSELTQGSNGNFYGTTSTGGVYGYGTIFKLMPNGSLVVLHNLSQDTDGANPHGSLVQGSDNNFYGMTNNGGKLGYGTIYKISMDGTFTVLRNLDFYTSGSRPKGNLIQGMDGNFYGMTVDGGADGYGTIFKFSANGDLQVLHHFYYFQGGQPFGSLIQGRDGNFYGMTSSRGINNAGTIFKITPAGDFTLLRAFNKITDGGRPQGSLVQGSDSYFYGITLLGGTYGNGTIFKINMMGDFTVLRHLNKEMDGAYPTGSLIIQKVNPIAYAQKVVAAEETARVITLRGTAPGSPLTYTILSKPKYGTLTGSGKNRIYTPKVNFAGSDSFTYNVTWGCQTSDTKTISITVTNVNDAPVLATIGNKLATTDSTLTFTARATEVDAGQTKTFSLVNAPTGAAIQASTGIFTWKPIAAGTYTFSVKVTDNGSPQLSDEKEITVIVKTLLPSIRLNSGGGTLTTSDGNFSADAFLTGSSEVATKAMVINNTTDDALYQDYRKATTVGGSFGYRIPVANGTYTLKLYFAELFHSAKGKRIFNVSAEGVSWLNNYDIFAAAGGAKRAITASRIITVSDGVLDIVFSSVIDRANVCAIAVVPAATGERLTMNKNDETLLNLEASIHPNPVSDKLTVKLTAPVYQLSSTITDLTGKVRNRNTHQLVDQITLIIPVTSLPAAVYLLQIRTEQGQQIFKFVKQ